MKRLALVTLGLLVLVAPARARQRTIRLSQGDTTVLPGASVTKVVATDPDVLEVRTLDNDKILLYGRSEGRAGLTIWRGKRVEKIKVVVSGTQVERFLTACSSLLGEACTFLKASSIEGRVVVVASVTDVETHDKIRKIMRAFKKVRFQVDVEPKVLDVLVPVINDELKKAGFDKAHVTRVGRRLLLQGNVASEEERRLAQIIVEEYYGGTLGKD